MTRWDLKDGYWYAKCVRNGNSHFPDQQVVQGCHPPGLKSVNRENDLECISLR